MVQSSGYGKSKLITHLKETNENYTVVYWSFGRETTIPGLNVNLSVDVATFASQSRKVLEQAFIVAINRSLDEVDRETQQSETHTVSSQETDQLSNEHDFGRKLAKSVIFVAFLTLFQGCWRRWRSFLSMEPC